MMARFLATSPYVEEQHTALAVTTSVHPYGNVMVGIASEDGAFMGIRLSVETTVQIVDALLDAAQQALKERRANGGPAYHG